MRVKRVFVEGLFGLFDHEVNMKTDDRITIIHAPNGFGKTSILRMIAALFQGRYTELRRFPFRVFGVEFEDGRTLRVEAKGGQPSDKGTRRPRRHKEDDRTLAFSLNGSGPFELPTTVDPREVNFPLDVIERAVPELTRVGPAEWQTFDGEVLHFEDVVERFGHVIGIGPGPARVPPWLAEAKKLVDVRFIRAERLMARLQSDRIAARERPAVLSPTVMRYSEELAAEIRKTLTQYAALSQALDRDFPARLVRHTGSEGLTINEVKGRLGEFEAKRARLTESGLLDAESGARFEVPPEIDAAKASVLSVYVGDVEKKLAVFDGLAEKIDLLKSIINRRFSHKRMAVNRDRGIQFTTDTGQPLDPINLSSGEQHELVMLYELLFKVRRDSLILIDEPEISLHIAWQQEFLQDLSEMVRLSAFDVLIATHSPQIISDRWDLTVELQDTPELQEAVR